MKHKKGIFYKRPDKDRFDVIDDSTVILCTESTNKESFTGVCVEKGNNSHVGQYSEHWTSNIFTQQVHIETYPLIECCCTKDKHLCYTRCTLLEE